MNRASEAQLRALLDVYVKGNFGLGVRYVTKAAVCGRGWVETGIRHPLQLTSVGRAALVDAGMVEAER